MTRRMTSSQARVPVVDHEPGLVHCDRLDLERQETQWVHLYVTYLR
jgi:hypothetical protein